VDLNEAAQRIFKFHWVLILLAVMVGVSIPALLFGSTGASYVASSRLVIGAEDARDGQQANALADTALALATSPAVLSEALGAAGVQRDPSEVADRVRVEPVGSSGVLQLSVTDPDPGASASIANALAAVIVQRREAAVLGDSEALLAETDAQIATLTQTVTDIEAAADAAARAAAAARARGLVVGDPLQAITLRHTQAVEQLGRAQEQRQALAQTLAQAVRPAVIDASATRGSVVESGLRARLALGALLGLIVGIALAATLEAWRPTLGPAALARHLGVPLLGRLRRLPARAVPLHDKWLVRYVALAADGAGVRSFELVPVAPQVDVTGLAESLAAEGDGGREIVPVALDRPHDYRLPARSYQPDAGIIVVAPRKVKTAWLANLERHARLTRQPVIGVISYRGKAPTVREDENAALDPLLRPTVDQDSAPAAAITS
jgi:capsular polysaccharide biosynthesis protein